MGEQQRGNEGESDDERLNEEEDDDSTSTSFSSHSPPIALPLGGEKRACRPQSEPDDAVRRLLPPLSLATGISWLSPYQIRPGLRTTRVTCHS